MTAQELLRAHVVKIPPDATMGDMVDILDLYQTLVIPVVDEDDRLLGAVYEEDVMRAVMGSDPAALRDHGARAAAGHAAKPVKAEEIMNAAAPSVDEHADALDALDMMAASGLTRLIVTGGGKVIGTISRVDICQALLEGEL